MRGVPWAAMPLIVRDEQAPVGTVYDREYYDTLVEGLPYRRGEPQWHQFFEAVARNIVSQLAPASVLDAGCAIGFLVEELRTRGVDAHGIDISEFAISQTPPELRPYCRVQSLTEELDGAYDLITCIEIVEHMPGPDAAAAIANICRHTDTVLFSSTPDDFEDATHLNVQASDYWISCFARHGFFRDFYHDASYVAPQAVLLRRRAWSAVEVARAYERGWLQAHRTAEGARTRETRLRNELQHTKAHRDDLARVHEGLAARVEEVAAERDKLSDALASEQAMLHQVTRELEAVHDTKLFRYSAPLRHLYERMRHLRRHLHDHV